MTDRLRAISNALRKAAETARSRDMIAQIAMVLHLTRAAKTGGIGHLEPATHLASRMQQREAANAEAADNGANSEDADLATATPRR